MDSRVPPHDLEAEAAVLSAVMVDPLALDKVIEFLQAEHFYSEAHRRVFEACLELSREESPSMLSRWPPGFASRSTGPGRWDGLPHRYPERRSRRGECRRVRQNDS